MYLIEIPCPLCKGETGHDSCLMCEGSGRTFVWSADKYRKNIR